MNQDRLNLLLELYEGGPFPEPEEQRTSHSTGVLSSQHIQNLVAGNRIRALRPIEDQQIQPASLDLRLGPVGYRVRASFLPGERTSVMTKIEHLGIREIDLTSPCVLEEGSVYIVPLMEELSLPRDISGKANPKSTTGRLDVFTRLITDGSREFERVEAGYRGKLYVEIVPRTFSVVVRQGTRVNQLRFLRGGSVARDTDLGHLHDRETLVYSQNEVQSQPTISQGLWIAVDLQGTDASDIIGYRAKRHSPVIDLEKVDYYDPLDFWEPIRRPSGGQLVLNPDDFYILASKEKIRIPQEYAAAMVPYDPSVGEFRVHYAGFFDPGFGYGSNDIKGTRAVLEVRSHEVPFLLEHGQIVGRLIYERLLAAPEKVYGSSIGSSYQAQGIALIKQFKPYAPLALEAARRE